MDEVLEQPGIFASPRPMSVQDPSHPKIPVNPRSQSAQDPSQHWMPSCLFGIWLMLLYLAHVKSASTKFFKYMLHTHLDFSHAYLAFPSLKKRISQVPTGSSRLMRISLLRIWLLRFFKAITKNLSNAIFMYYYFS